MKCVWCGKVMIQYGPTSMKNHRCRSCGFGVFKFVRVTLISFKGSKGRNSKKATEGWMIVGGKKQS